MDDFRIQYVGIFNKGVFNKWGNTVIQTRDIWILAGDTEVVISIRNLAEKKHSCSSVIYGYPAIINGQ